MDEELRLGCVYFIGGEATGLVKIGWTTGDPEIRLAQLQPASPVLLVPFGFERGTRRLEHFLHMRFVAHRARGEWFHLCDEMHDYIQEHAVPFGELSASVCKANLSHALQMASCSYNSVDGHAIPASQNYLSLTQKLKHSLRKVLRGSRQESGPLCVEPETKGIAEEDAMLAREFICQAEDGIVSVDYVKADVARSAKRKTNLVLTPTQEMELRDKVWFLLAREGLTTYEIAKACARAAQSERNIRRRLKGLAVEVRDQAEAG